MSHAEKEQNLAKAFTTFARVAESLPFPDVSVQGIALAECPGAERKGVSKPSGSWKPVSCLQKPLGFDMLLRWRSEATQPALTERWTERLPPNYLMVLACLLVFVIAFGFYLLTLAPTVTLVDSGELILACHSLGIAHPPGFPLYVLIGHLFAQLPFGNVAYRLNLMSALFAALTALTVFCAVRLIKANRTRLLSLLRFLPHLLVLGHRGRSVHPEHLSSQSGHLLTIDMEN